MIFVITNIMVKTVTPKEQFSFLGLLDYAFNIKDCQFIVVAIYKLYERLINDPSHMEICY